VDSKSCPPWSSPSSWLPSSSSVFHRLLSSNNQGKYVIEQHEVSSRNKGQQMINTMWVNRNLSTWTRRSFVSFFQLVERKCLLAPCDSYNLDLHWTHLVQVITTNDYLTQTEYFNYCLWKHHCPSKMLATICHIKLLRVQVQSGETYLPTLC
jgi:hypothetical protein